LGGPNRPNPIDRAKNGVKRSLLVEADGGPLSVVIAGANVPDFKLLAATLEAIVVARPEPTEEAPQHLCLDKGYDKQPAREVVERHDYQAHIRRIGEQKKDLQGKKRYPARRWVAMGSGAHAGLVVEVPLHPGTLREEGCQLPGAD
jgi:putative transposase